MRTQATATVRVVIEVAQGSTWGPDCTVGQVQAQASEAARRTVESVLCDAGGAKGMTLVRVEAVDVRLTVTRE